MKKTSKAIFLTGVGISCLPSLVWAKQNVQQPNILFILCDDMGYGDLACLVSHIFILLTSTKWHAKVCVSLRHMQVRQFQPHRELPS